MKSTHRYEWSSFGDINAYFGLLLDNLAGLLLTVSLLVGAFGMPADFVVGSMVPGTAIGVLVGDLLYTWLAFRLSSRTMSQQVTAMPLGLDTPSIFGITIFVVGPAFLGARATGMPDQDAARFAWHIGICSMIYSGIFKVICSFLGPSIRRIIPRAGLFGSLTSIALVIISFVPLIDIMREPIAGLVALAIVLTCLIGQVRLPYHIPGTVAALVVAGLIHCLTAAFLGHNILEGQPLNVGFMPAGWIDAFRMDWWQQMGVATNYLPIVIPFALATVVGGLDCAESASAAGDHYSTFQILGVEALATLVAGFCGGVIQTTPYIGHPAYKAMGGKAAYTLATAVTVGIMGIIGGFEYFYMIVPKSAVFPILIFVGLEISAQSFIATPKRHYPALVFACVPALAFLAFFFVDQLLGGIGIQLSGEPLSTSMQSSIRSIQEAVAGNETATKAVDGLVGALSLRPDLRDNLLTVLMLKNGFVLTSLVWASILAMAIDRRMKAAAFFSGFACLCTLFGFIHCPLSNNALFLPIEIPSISSSWVLPSQLQSRVFSFAFGYLAIAVLFLAWGKYLEKVPGQEPIFDKD